MIGKESRGLVREVSLRFLTKEEDDIENQAIVVLPR